MSSGVRTTRIKVVRIVLEDVTEDEAWEFFARLDEIDLRMTLADGAEIYGSIEDAS